MIATANYGWVILHNVSNGMQSLGYMPYSTGEATCTLPISAGQVCYFEGQNINIEEYYFIYAKGEEPNE